MIRDLEAEGALPANSKSVGMGEMSIFSALIELQHDVKSLKQDIARLFEVNAGLAAKVRCLEAIDRQPLEIKGEWHTGGIDQ